MTSHDCPTGQQLEAFALGQIGDVDADPIAQHLEACPRCAETIDRWSESTDPVLARVRQPAQPGLYEADRQCQQAVARVKEYGHDPSFSAASAEMQTATSGLAASAPSTALPPRQLRDYQLLEKLGEGGMGAVYKARHERLDKLVALKVLPAERMQDAPAVARFQREMRAVGQLDHPNIVRAMDAGEVDGTHFLVMEYVEGVDLSQLVKRHGPLPIPAACELIRQAAIGLEEAHEHGMVHRDIKPSNLMLCVAGKRKPPVVKILDMGLALLSDAHAPGTRELTTTGQMMGTLDYMAPEQGGDSKKVDIRADIYALGATLYRLLTGQVIYHGEKYQTPVQKMMALALEPAPPIQGLRKELSPELAAIVHRMLEKSPDRRYATPQNVADVLTPFCAGADLAVLLAGSSSVSTATDVSLAGTEPDLRSSDVATDDRSPHAPHEENRAAQPVDPDHRRDFVTRNATTTFKPTLIAALAAGGIAILLAGILLLWKTPAGTVRIEILDDQIQAKFDRGGLIITGHDKEPIKITPTANAQPATDEKAVPSGEHTLTITRGQFRFQTTNFQLHSKGATILKIELLAGEVRVSQDGKLLSKEALPQVAAAPPEVADSQGRPPSPANAPFDAARAREHQQAWAKHLGVPWEYTNSLDMKFVLIPPGEFTMGSSRGEIDDVERFLLNSSLPDGVKKNMVGQVKSQGPQHPVILTQPFFLSVFETTELAYERAMAFKPASFVTVGLNNGQPAKVSGEATAVAPVNMISWYDAAEFCNELSEIESHQPAYVFTAGGVGRVAASGYRLPTEAEWEFACRAGTTTRYWLGDDQHVLDLAGWTGANSGGRPHAVGQLRANPFGLYDMAGNLSEWCHDYWGPTYYEQSAQPVIDPSGLSSNHDNFFSRSLRGGDWLSHQGGCSSAARASSGGFYTGDRLGCRLVLTVEAVRQAIGAPQTVAAKPVRAEQTRIAKLVSKKWPPAMPNGDNALAIDRGGRVSVPTLEVDAAGPCTLEAYVTRLSEVPRIRGVVRLTDGEIGINLISRWMVAWTGKQGPVDVVGSRVVTGQRVHVAVVVAAGHLHFYVDGQRVAESMLGEVPAQPRKGFELGTSLEGILDEVRVSKIARYDQNFTPEVRFEPDENTLALYHCDEAHGDVLTDSSGHKHHGKIVGAQWVASARDYALQFGGDRHVALPRDKINGELAALDDFTIEAVAACEGEIPQEVVGLFVSALQLRLTYLPASAAWALMGPQGPLVKAAAAWKPGERVHLAAVKQNDEFRFYVDGKLRGQEKRPGDRLPPGNGLVSLGASSGSFPGRIEEFRISKTARYEQEFPPETRFTADASAIVLYHFEEGSGDQLTDSSNNQHHGKIGGAKWVQNANAGSPLPEAPAKE